jgi:bifunctional non-homologous end joining protein LigD
VSPSQRLKPTLPTQYDPELATLVKVPPSGEEWLHEIKFDGYRFGCRIDGGKVKLITRRGHDWTTKLPRIASRLPRVMEAVCNWTTLRPASAT